MNFKLQNWLSDCIGVDNFHNLITINVIMKFEIFEKGGGFPFKVLVDGAPKSLFSKFPFFLYNTVDLAFTKTVSPFMISYLII